MKKLVLIGLLLGGLVAAPGCGVDLTEFWPLSVLLPEDVGSDGSSAEPKLLRFASEDELRDYLVGQSAGDRGVVEEVFNESSVGVAADNSTGAGSTNELAVPSAAPTAGDADQSAGSQSADGGAAGDAYSTTTEQEEGVQESDVIKNDGQYIYILSRGVLRIVQAAPATALAEVSSLELGGSGYDLFLAGDKVVALTYPDPEPTADVDTATDGMGFMPFYYYYEPQVEATIIDVADRAAPSVVSKARFDGNLNGSRMIGDMLYLVLVDYPQSIFVAYDAETGEPQVEDVPLGDLLPEVTIEVAGENVYSGPVAEFTDFYRPEDPDGLGITTVVGLDINAPEQFSAEALVGYPAVIYSSTEALYITNYNWDWSGNLRTDTAIYKFDLTDAGPQLAAVGGVPGRVINQYAMGEYNGFLRVATTIDPTWGLNGIEAESSNHVYVLEQVAEKLEIVGRVENLGLTEFIYSARFIGDRGYVVTFRQTDPLYTLDLSDPRNPQMVGELKVPGFSTFMVPLGDDYLLTIGQNAEENEWGFTVSEGVQLSIFDVSNFADPQLAWRELIGTNGGYSEALYNPKALTWFPEGNLLAFPMEIYDWSWGWAEPMIGDGIEVEDDAGGADGSAGTEDTGATPRPEDGSDPTDAATSGLAEDSSGEGETGAETGSGDDATTNGNDTTSSSDDAVDNSSENDGTDVVDDSIPPVEPSVPAQPTERFLGLYVYEVTTEGGFRQLGRISTDLQTDNSDSYYWYYPEFTRGVFIGSTVYAVTSDSVQAAATNAVATVVSTVNFPIPEYNYPGPVFIEGLDDVGAATSDAPAPDDPAPDVVVE